MEARRRGRKDAGVENKKEGGESVSEGEGPGELVGQGLEV